MFSYVSAQRWVKFPVGQGFLSLAQSSRMGQRRAWSRWRHMSRSPGIAEKHQHHLVEGLPKAGSSCVMSNQVCPVSPDYCARCDLECHGVFKAARGNGSDWWGYIRAVTQLSSFREVIVRR